MTKKQTFDTVQVGTDGDPIPKTRKARVPKEISPEAKAFIDMAANQVREAKALGKVVDLISGMGEWGLDQLGSAIQRRRNIISPGD